MNKISFILAIAVASASCYDFLNGDRLFELPITRFKRAQQGLPHCCGNDFSGDPVLFLGEPTQECVSKHPPAINKDIKTQMNWYICIQECISKNQGTVHDGEVDKEKVMEFLRNYDHDEYRMKVFEENLDKCISEAKEIQERLGGKSECDSTAASLIRCLERVLIENCPEDKQNMDQEKKCGKMKLFARLTYDQVFQ